MKKREYNLVQLQNVEISDTALSSADIEDIRLESLLFQAGYLTIDQVYSTDQGLMYKLRVPNKEVQILLNQLFAEYLTKVEFNKEKRNISRFDWEKIK